MAEGSTQRDGHATPQKKMGQLLRPGEKVKQHMLPGLERTNSLAQAEEVYNDLGGSVNKRVFAGQEIGKKRVRKKERCRKDTIWGGDKLEDVKAEIRFNAVMEQDDSPRRDIVFRAALSQSAPSRSSSINSTIPSLQGSRTSSRGSGQQSPLRRSFKGLLRSKSRLREEMSEVEMIEVARMTKQAKEESTTKFTEVWDIVILVLLFWTALMCPFEVTFLESVNTLDSAGAISWFICIRLVDFLFAVDICVKLVTAYDSDAKLGAVRLEKVLTQEDTAEEQEADTASRNKHMLKEAQKDYLRGWFFIDLISILPYDLITMLIQEAGDASDLKLLRLLRLFRIARLLRLTGARKIIDRLSDRLSLDFAMIRLTTVFLGLLIGTHWLACLWGFGTSIEDAEINWMVKYFGTENPAVNQRYSACFYFAFITLSSIGYGDITPVTEFERFVCILCMILGTCSYSVLSALIFSLANEADSGATKYQHIRNDLAGFMEANELPVELQIKLRRHLRLKMEKLVLFSWKSVFSAMDTTLQEEVVMYTEKELMGHDYFRLATPTARTALVKSMQGCAFGKLDTVFSYGSCIDKMYVVKSGIVVHMGCKYLGKGSVVGDDLLATLTLTRGSTRFNLRDYTSVCATFVFATSISAVDLEKIYNSFPELKTVTKHIFVKHTFKSHVWGYCNAMAQIQCRKMIKTGVPDHITRHYAFKLAALRRYRDHRGDIVKLQALARGRIGRAQARRFGARRRKADAARDMRLLLNAMAEVKADHSSVVADANIQLAKQIEMLNQHVRTQQDTIESYQETFKLLESRFSAMEDAFGIAAPPPPQPVVISPPPPPAPSTALADDPGPPRRPSVGPLVDLDEAMATVATDVDLDDLDDQFSDL